MMLHDSKLWLSDLDETIASIPELSGLNGKSILITGATGLICSAIIELFIRYNDLFKGNIRVYGAGRNNESMRNRFGKLLDRDDFSFVGFDATRNDNYISESADYVIYGASNAVPTFVMKEPVETMRCNFTGLNYFLEYARECNIKRLLYISSSEIYGKKTDNSPFDENDYGYIDLLNPRNSYSVGKRAAETLCASYGTEYGVNIVIVRPGHIYGPTALKRDTRVSSLWANDVAMGKDIVMKSDGSQIRSYCYCLDCASAIIKVLLKGEKLQAYNISSKSSVYSIRQLAEMLCDVADTKLRIELPDDAEKKQFNPMNNSSLNGQKLNELGWSGLFDGRRGVYNTVSILKEIAE